ncbi:MAG: glycoside hydrolase family 9 protein [Sedimentisphaerales bacterium]|nr:glycoside hydrolase family 9 protein [Sedimentisphaerales bacterium]
MKMKSFLFVIIFLMAVVSSAQAGQECVGINFFDVAQSYLQTYTCWDGGKSYIYSGGATVANCNGAVPVDMSIGAGSLKVQSIKPAGSWWNILFKLDWGHSVNFYRYGRQPFLYLRVKWGQIATGANMGVRLVDDQQILNLYNYYAGQPGTYSSQEASVLFSDYVAPSTSEWQDVYIPVEDFLNDNPNLDLTRISILIFDGVGTYEQTNTLYIEKMKVVPDIDGQYSDVVKINQLGYLPTERKLALVSYENGAFSITPTYFQVIDVATQTAAYQGNLVRKIACSPEWDQSGDIVYRADFTSLATPGTYFISVPELEQTSLVFDIKEAAFNQAYRDALRFFYYARSGNDIAEPYAEGFTRPTIYANNAACQYDYNDNDPAKMYDYDPLDEGITTRDVCGGWFDAGDLHLDTHNNIVTLWFLLEILKQQGDKLGPYLLNLPESDGQANDLVHLIKYQLEWFKKMQNSDGSVHFIVINNGDDSHQQVSDVSTGAACVLAGIFAKASAKFANEPGQASYAADLLSRAELSWTWLQAHPNNYNPTGPSGQTWSYGITNDVPYRMFAAIELYIATGNTTYRSYFQNAFIAAGGNALTAFTPNQSWGGILGLFYDPSINLAYMDYVQTTRSVSSTIKNHLKQKFLDQAAFILSKDECTNYNIPMVAPNHLFWGSSGMLCANAYVLLRAYEWTGNASYRNAALDALEWIGGRNPVCRIFITGYSDYLHGTDHYSFYWFDHLNPTPGYLCGNINGIGAGGYFLDYYIRYPWKYYLNIQNASVLEPCLPWQAELSYLLGYFASDLDIPGDINFDGAVNMADLTLFIHAWLSSPGDANWNPNANLAQPFDNIIDFADFATLMLYFN